MADWHSLIFVSSNHYQSKKCKVMLFFNHNSQYNVFTQTD